MKIIGHIYILVSAVLGVAILISANVIYPLQMMANKQATFPSSLIHSEFTLALALRMSGALFFIGLALLIYSWVKREKAK